MAEILSAIHQRYACRSFASELVAGSDLQSILEAGRIAPSGFGMEPWRFVVVQSAGARSSVAAACFNQSPALTAPVLIALVAVVDALYPDSSYVQSRLEAEAGGPVPAELRSAYRGFIEQADVREWAIAQCNFPAAQMMIQAASLGLATCPIGGFAGAALSRALQLSPGESPALVLALGRCAHGQGERRRKPLEVVCF